MKHIFFKHTSRKLSPTTHFKGNSEKIIRHSVGDYWQWAYSDLMQNIERGVLAEYIVAVLLDIDEKPRTPWLPYDLELSDGKRIEVKTMSRLQAWFQKELSSPRVVIKRTRKWDPKTGIMEDIPKLHSDLYIICYFTAEKHDEADPLNLAQWKFFVFDRTQIMEILKERKSISHKFLQRSRITPVSAFELKSQVIKLST